MSDDEGSVKGVVEELTEVGKGMAHTYTEVTVDIEKPGRLSHGVRHVRADSLCPVDDLGAGR
jgi:hypothetical protein